MGRLSARIRALFWDCDARAISWCEDREFIISRVLSAGDWQTVRWLRRRIGDQAIGEWIAGRQGRGLSPERLRYWEIALDLPHRVVSAWLADPARAVWDRRAAG